MGKGAKEPSLFIFWVNLCLQNGSCWRDQFILGTEEWRWGMGEDVFWRGAATINKQAQPGIFQKDAAPLYKTPFSGQTSARSCKAGEDLLQGSCSNVFEHLHHSQELLMSFSTQPTSLQVTSVLSPPLTFTKMIGPEGFYIVTLEAHQQHFWALIWIFVHAGN